MIKTLELTVLVENQPIGRGLLGHHGELLAAAQSTQRLCFAFGA